MLINRLTVNEREKIEIQRKMSKFKRLRYKAWNEREAYLEREGFELDQRERERERRNGGNEDELKHTKTLYFKNVNQKNMKCGKCCKNQLTKESLIHSRK